MRCMFISSLKTWSFGPGQRQLAMPWKGTTRIQNSGDRIQNKVIAFGSAGKYKMCRREATSIYSDFWLLDFLYETWFEIPPGRNSEQIERRTSNAQHRTSNIDDATLYLILKQVNCSLRRALRTWAQDRTTQPNWISKDKFALLSLFLNWQNTLFDVGRSMFDVRCSFFN